MAAGRYDELLTSLSRHLSQTHAKLTLDRSLRACGLADGTVAEKDLPFLIPRIKHTAAFFLAPRRLEALEKDLQSIWKVSQVGLEPELIPIRTEPDIVVARARARDICAALGAGRMNTQKVATVVSEFARNIVSYTPGGEIELITINEPKSVLVKANDRGSGIPNLDEILAGRYRSRTGLGRGIIGSRQLAERMSIDTGPNGTRIEAVLRI